MKSPERKREAAITRLLRNGWPERKIAKTTGVPIAQVKEIARRMKT